MVFLLIVGIPTLIILGLVISLKLNSMLSYIVIILLGILSTYAVDYIYCNILGFECIPDALTGLGLIIHSLLVIIFSSIIYNVLCNKYKKIKDKGGS